VRVSVFGLGYVGCVTAASLAKAGHQVVGVDINEEKLRRMAAGQSPIVEPGLDALIAEVVHARRLTVTSSADVAVRESDLALICVGTPGDRRGRLSLDAVERALEQIGRALHGQQKPFTVVIRSTLLPGTTERTLIPRLLAEMDEATRALVRVAVNPEFMREGTSLRDFSQPPCTLVGCDDPDTVTRLRSLYLCVQAPFVETSVRTAELAKYVSNTFHALKICFANEIGDICQAFDVDIRELLQVFFQDRKLNISEAYLRPGFAFGGSCLPKDVRALLAAGHDADLPLPLLSSILPANAAQIQRAANAVLETGLRRIGIVGLAFKAATDDLRESPMVTLAETLIGKGCDVRILDRSVAIAKLLGTNRDYIERQIPHIASLMCDNADELAAHADVIVLGNAGDEMLNVLDAVQPHQTVIDLTRGQLRPNPVAVPVRA
jgi:GDP-mannose 6-dehydrogenase